MTTTFPSNSRFANFREKRISQLEDQPTSTQKVQAPAPTSELKLSEQKSTYQPTFGNTRTSMRLLKGKIERNQSSQKYELKSNQDALNLLNLQTKSEIEQKKSGLRLTLNDFEQVAETKPVQEPPKPPQKRILIQKKISVDEQKKTDTDEQTKLISNEPQSKAQNETKPSNKPAQQPISTKPLTDIRPVIQQQDMEQSKDQPENDNDLLLCPQGCGRKFNRRALQKHVKACKIVFMSKRKQFNSQAKRITSKQQAGIIKQTKQKEKNQFGKTKSKHMEKTGENWKAASKDFREAIKAVKKEEDEGQEQEQEVDADLQLVDCQYCEKKFAKVLLDKHYENCQKKKEREQRKKTTKKK